MLLINRNIRKLQEYSNYAEMKISIIHKLIIFTICVSSKIFFGVYVLFFFLRMFYIQKDSNHCFSKLFSETDDVVLTWQFKKII
jgi:hypothetical protein